MELNKTEGYCFIIPKYSRSIVSLKNSLSFTPIVMKDQNMKRYKERL